MDLVLSLPGLLAPDAERSPEAPHLARLIATGGTPAREPDGLDAALAAQYRIARGDDWPLAPIRAASLGVDPGDAFWLRADPVTLEAGRDDVRLVGPVRDLADADAAALVAALNTHFADDGLAFVAPERDAWFLRSPRPLALRTRPLAVVAGRMVRELLPTGPSSGEWRRWQNEIEMLLHGHPVNASRESAGRAVANGVWICEGGRMPPAAGATRAVATFAGGGIAVALARHAGASARGVPAALDAALTAATGAQTIVVALAAPPDIAAVERAWARPAWLALASGRLQAVTIVADGGDGAFAWTARRPGSWRRLIRSLSRPDLAQALAGARAPS
jgi:hypothetical protein